ncbi:MAG TPA: hypothetical protein VMU66_05995, partial [Gaiellales bacterium]|nr:hypothetical protein [Gaiellales bacterium]
DPRSPEHGQYGFLQDLMRRVAYETLSRRDRSDRHLAAAAYLEQSSSDEDEIVEMLASHYLDASTAAPDLPDADAVRRRACELLRRAADRAESLGAPSEAQRYCAQAAGLTSVRLEQAELLDRAGEMAYRAAAMGAAVELSERARSLYEDAGEAVEAARVLVRLSRIDQIEGRLVAAIEGMERAHQVLSVEGPAEDLAGLSAMLGGAHYFAGDVVRAAELAERALDTAEALGLPSVLVDAILVKSMIGASGRHPEEARGLFQLALELATRHGLRSAASRACGNLSDLAFRRDRYTAALAHLEQAGSLARMIGDRRHEWFALSESCYALYMLGRWDDALASFAELPRARLATAGTLLSPLSSVLEIHVHRGDLDAARDLFAVYARMEQAADIQEQAVFASATACMLFSDGRHAEAIAAGAQTIELARTLGLDGQDVKQGVMWGLEAAVTLGDRDRIAELTDWIEAIPPGLRPPSLDGHMRRARARIAASVEAAHADHVAAVAQFRSLGMEFWMAVSLLEHAERLAPVMPEAAEPLVLEASDVFDRLRAVPWLARAAAVPVGGARTAPRLAG